jgi:hypothetical protein
MLNVNVGGGLEGIDALLAGVGLSAVPATLTEFSE